MKVTFILPDGKETDWDVPAMPNVGDLVTIYDVPSDKAVYKVIGRNFSLIVDRFLSSGVKCHLIPFIAEGPKEKEDKNA